jgi:hypothetical protein
MKTTEEKLRRLEGHYLGLLVVVVILCITTIGAVGYRWVSSAAESLIYTLSVNWEPDGGLRFTSSSDGPFIVMYLEHGFSTAEQRTARLPEPIVITDSTGARLSKEEVKQLKWRDAWGRPIAAPKEGAEIKAFYFRPKVAVERK